MSQRLAFAAGLLLTGACSRDYVPAAGAGGEQIYCAACRDCHPPAANSSIFLLKRHRANIKAIAGQIRNCSRLMPAFPRLTDGDLFKISNYALEHSDFAEE